MGLKINNMSVSFSGNVVLNNLSIPEIHPGEMVSLIGKNGAGKSTILKQMTKLIRLNPKLITLDEQSFHCSSKLIVQRKRYFCLSKLALFILRINYAQNYQVEKAKW